MKKTIIIHGIHCRSCEELIKDALLKAGINKIDFKGNKATLFFDEKKTGFSRIKRIIKKEGYDVK
ncbi:hypothetical protein COZ55_01685 [archaeon CG_4_8_14_3_um_filter_38_5]|nr:MAG: hypothetical protein COS83_02365 [archaeon CG07_land_8_20_14_0_80_38_8]PIU89213.1 MAG: hypothetical protein COS64_01330 [archaeon CG06_land_8_20_14_3_00_37_11]PIX42865.1 MAG: hypothetical protein COZ55_01685 [archaeon CG_4_8_14_3_um_filter_38_5]